MLAVYREARTAIERARSGGGPAVLELMTLRMEGHAVHDDAAYVPPELFDALGRAGSRAPLRGLDARARASSPTTSSTGSSATSRPRSPTAVTRAEASPWPDPDTLEDGVYAG